jgi:hypothetical protein
MPAIYFDDKRDCTTLDGKQDIRIENYQGAILIGQWDGTGETFHSIVVPPHLATKFRETLLALPAEQSMVLDAVL